MDNNIDPNLPMVVNFTPTWTFIWRLIWGGLCGNHIQLRFPLGALMTEQQALEELNRE